VVARNRLALLLWGAAALLFAVRFQCGGGPPEPWFTAGARPTPLDANEEASPAAERLARRFNPAMAFSDGSIWPVDVSYAWSDGADLVASVLERNGKVARSYVAAKNADLERKPWANLPDRDPSGRRIRYSIDAPGDDRTSEGRTRWRARWDSLTADGRFPPTQHAHLYWLNRAEGLLAIQYWFFYPFNEWINRHEGDWEHVTVILRGSNRLREDATWSPVGYQFAFHNWRFDTDEVVRVGGPEPGEDHVVVFVGGSGRMLWWQGTMSGASYPLPALYRGAASGPVKADEDTRAPRRFIAPARFRIVMLPEPDRLDARARPQLSWLTLPFYAGQERTYSNPPLMDWLGHGGPVQQPARRPAWNSWQSKPSFPHQATAVAASLALPPGWRLLAAPWLGP
jgi:hypothetical protein